jgi:predicted nucleic acid-binding protein
MATFPIVIDACVLFNAPVRDTLLRAAEHGFCRVHWSKQILDETTNNLIEHAKMGKEKAQYLVAEISKHFLMLW